MGMYTQLNVNFTLKENVDSQVIFKLESKIRTLFSMSSYYFNRISNSKIRYDEISKQYSVAILCDFKNYNNEINTFLNWIAPHIENGEFDKEFIGYQRYEENELPTLIFIKQGVIL